MYFVNKVHGSIDSEKTQIKAKNCEDDEALYGDTYIHVQ